MGPTVTVRIRKIKNGKMGNLYLDYYFSRGIRKRETIEGLQLYLKPKNALERDHNKTTQLLADEIRSKKQMDIHYGRKISKPQKVRLLSFFVDLMKERQGTNYGNWDSCFKHLEKYSGNEILLNDISTEFVIGFRDYLLNQAKTKSNKNLSNNSCISYFNKFRACINEAFDRGLIEINPLKGVKRIKEQDVVKTFLTEEELKKLIDHPCPTPIIKKAFIFSCFTGLRFSDIQQLKGTDVVYDKDEVYIQFRQQKTKAIEYLPLNRKALEIIESFDKGDGKIFRGLRYSGHNNQLLREWALKSGIKKHITFHSARHTFATLLLGKTGDLYLVSKLLGHSEIKTTTIYAKIIDQNKQKAVNSLNSIISK